ncbi:MAG: hypothetical protein ACLUH6_05595 [Bacteroides faecis]|uniref:Uncharacterized protein n=1 Tax=Bacteroides faecis TaxID=674529 RepID=A0A6N2V4C1_9BACE
MKEYVADTGGRYTYVDDILNLQALALSMTAIFSGCEDFIISGCEITGNAISSGYVWINGKVRYFEGCTAATFPYYIYEKNGTDTVVYAGDVNKKGRNNYLCAGSSVLPSAKDALTGKVPCLIEITKAYAPRFLDKFFGHYAVLLETPFSKQTIKKDLVVTGKLTTETGLESKTAISVVSPSGYSLKQLVKQDGTASFGSYLNGLLVSEICISTDGSLLLMKDKNELARIDENGITYTHASCSSSRIGYLQIEKNSIVNVAETTDEGSVDINAAGPETGANLFRDFRVFDGKQAGVPLLHVKGKTKEVRINGDFSVAGKSIAIISDASGTKALYYMDAEGTEVASAGFVSGGEVDFSLINKIGDIRLSPKESVNITGDLKVNEISLKDIYVNKKSFTESLAKKVNVVDGKQLSTEDFTAKYKKKLDAISTGEVQTGGEGYVTATQVKDALAKKLTVSSNLADVPDKKIARASLDIYSREETGNLFLKISGNLQELVTLTSDEINGLTTEQAAAMKAEKQAAVRDNLDAEKKGTGALKLTKTSNLSDLPDKVSARKNISVYSTTEVDKLLAGKLGTDSAYTGVVFTPDMKQKLEGIKTGSFAYVDNDDVSHAEVEGYVLLSHVRKELAKKAGRLLDGYTDEEKASIATNINVYSRIETDTKYAGIAMLFQDYINYLVGQGKKVADAQKILRDKLDVLSKADVSGTYLRKDSKLSDLSLPNTDAKKQVCSTLGAAYAQDYQTKIADTGWLRMANSGNGTDTSRLFVRQIGNIVCIQGIINTARRDGSNMGGTVAVLPNGISAPRYGVRTTLCDWNDDAKYNRGTSFVLSGGSRNIRIFESGWYNVDTDMNFTYMV